MEEEKDRKQLPTMSPEYLTKNNLWDSSWLQQKYPERFNNKNK